MEITAKEAQVITEKAKIKPNAWDVLFDAILYNAESGKSMLIFDERKYGVEFEEHRKDVKKKLEELGYNVSYSRVRDDEDYYYNTFHNEYTISW